MLRRGSKRSSRRAFVQTLGGASLASLAPASAAAVNSIRVNVRGRKSFSVSSIVLCAESSPSERWAAAELGLWLERMTGVRLPVVEAGKETLALSKVIAVGQSSLTDGAQIEVPHFEACLLRIHEDAIVLAGGRQRGTMYGVFEFLDRLGCRWFTPDVTRVPRVQALSLRPFDEVARPAFEYREVFFTEAQGKEWSARNRLNGNFHQLDQTTGGKVSYLPFAHSFYELVPPDRYFDEHPEYFAMVAGKRRRRNAQLCLTNNDIVNLAVDRAERWLAERADVSVISISQNDGGGWCECDPCRQIITEEGGAISGLLLRFVNQVAARIAASHPEKIIDTLAYQATADPPLHTRPLANVQIRLSPIDACPAHSYEACAFNRRFRERLIAWAKIAPRLHLWLYSINFAHFLAPFPNEAALAADIPRFRHAGVSGIFLEGAVSDGGGGDDAELRSYLAARLLWNPAVNIARETSDFLHEVYGPAGPWMQKYFTLRRSEIEPGKHLWFDQNIDALYLTESFLAEARRLLNRAVEAAVTPASKQRVDRFRLGLDYVEAMRSRRCAVNGPVYAAASPERVRQETQAFVRRAQSLGITHLREGYPIAQQAADLDAMAREYNAIELSGTGLTAVIAPDLGGRIISLSPAGQAVNLLRAPDPGEPYYPRAGGLYVVLAADYLSNPAMLVWTLAGRTPDSVSLRSQSTEGLTLELVIRNEGGNLRLQLVVTNPTSTRINAVLGVQAEFAFGSSLKAQLTYVDSSGAAASREIEAGDRPADGRSVFTGLSLPKEEWTLRCPDSLLHLANRFRSSEVSRAALTWSFRSDTKLNLSLWTPESVLEPGQRLTLASEYYSGALRSA